MTRTTSIKLVLTSGAAAVATAPIYVGGNKMAFQVVSAPGNLVDLEGSLDGTTWVDLNYDNIAGAYTLTVISNVGAGYYEVFERPEYVRMLVEIDATPNRDYHAVLLVKKESD
jgi:hypothetical protein